VPGTARTSDVSIEGDPGGSGGAATPGVVDHVLGGATMFAISVELVPRSPGL
jgi:hypothetical protein